LRGAKASLCDHGLEILEDALVFHQELLHRMHALVDGRAEILQIIPLAHPAALIPTARLQALEVLAEAENGPGKPEGVENPHAHRHGYRKANTQ